jgi:hypothetical protein
MPRLALMSYLQFFSSASNFLTAFNARSISIPPLTADVTFISKCYCLNDLLLTYDVGVSFWSLVISTRIHWTVFFFLSGSSKPFYVKNTLYVMLPQQQQSKIYIHVHSTTNIFHRQLHKITTNVVQYLKPMNLKYWNIGNKMDTNMNNKTNVK